MADMRNAPHTTETTMNQADMDRMHQDRLNRRMRELASDLADLVRNGDLTGQQANEWMNDKAQQWAL